LLHADEIDVEAFTTGDFGSMRTAGASTKPRDRRAILKRQARGSHAPIARLACCHVAEIGTFGFAFDIKASQGRLPHPLRP